VEDEAVLDRGASFVKHVCDEEEVEGKSTELLTSMMAG
jgi:sodium bicarbonate cotransporter 4